MRPYMRAANVGWNGLRLDDVKEMDFTPTEFETYELRPGDVLVGEASGSRDEVGKSSVWRGEVPGACFQNTLIRVRLDTARATPEFVQLHLQHDATRGALAEVCKGIGIYHLGREGLANWQIGVPPLDEQRRIVAKLDALRARSRRAKDALDAVPVLLDRLRRSILAAAFRGDLTADWREQNPDVEPATELLKRIRIERRKRWEEAELAKMTAKGKPPKDDRWKQKYVEPEPVDDSELPELPDGWCWASVDEIVRGGAALCYGVVQPGEDTNVGIPLIRVQDLFSQNLQPKFLRRITAEVDREYLRSRVEEGDVLISVVGTIGRVATVPKSLSGANIARAVARIRASGLIDRSWVAAWLSSPTAQFQLGLDAREVARKTLNVEVLAGLAIPIAPRDEQRAAAATIAEMINRIDGAAAVVAQTVPRVAATEAAILAAAFRGELVEATAAAASE